MVSLGGARHSSRQLICTQHFFNCNLPRPTQNPDTSGSVLRILCKQIDSPDQLLNMQCIKKACIQDIFASVCMLFLCGDIILQFYFRIMAFLTFLRIRFGISSLSPQILTLPQLPCNPKDSSRYNFRFLPLRADESLLPHVSQSPSSPSLLSDPVSQFSLRLPHQTRIPEG